MNEPLHTELIEDLIAWSTDPDGIDREALGNVDRDGWGIEIDEPPGE